MMEDWQILIKGGNYSPEISQLTLVEAPINKMCMSFLIHREHENLPPIFTLLKYLRSSLAWSPLHMYPWHEKASPKKEGSCRHIFMLS